MNRPPFAGMALAASCLLAAAGCATHAPAASPPGGAGTLRIGATGGGTIDGSDPILHDGRGRFEVYRLDARRGQRLAISMASEAFDPYLVLARTVAGVTDRIRENDDRGEGTSSRIGYTFTEDGSYLVLAQSLDADGAGAYTLRVEELPPPARAVPRAVRSGEPVSGSLQEGDAVDDADETLYDVYTFSGSAGQRLDITLTSDKFDTFLRLGQMRAGVLTTLAEDDDAGGGTNSRIQVTLPADGEYTIRASALSEGERGAYTLRIVERPEPAATPIHAGRSVRGTLDENDPVTEDNAAYDLYVLRARAGEPLRITMRSDAFDTYLAIGRMEGGAFTELGSIDDGADGTNSLLEFTAPATGEYVIRATALEGGSKGPYSLDLKPGR